MVLRPSRGRPGSSRAVDVARGTQCSVRSTTPEIASWRDLRSARCQVLSTKREYGNRSRGPQDESTRCTRRAVPGTTLDRPTPPGAAYCVLSTVSSGSCRGGALAGCYKSPPAMWTNAGVSVDQFRTIGTLCCSATNDPARCARLRPRFCAFPPTIGAVRSATRKALRLAFLPADRDGGREKPPYDIDYYRGQNDGNDRPLALAEFAAELGGTVAGRGVLVDTRSLGVAGLVLGSGLSLRSTHFSIGCLRSSIAFWWSTGVTVLGRSGSAPASAAAAGCCS